MTSRGVHIGSIRAAMVVAVVAGQGCTHAPADEPPASSIAIENAWAIHVDIRKEDGTTARFDLGAPWTPLADMAVATDGIATKAVTFGDSDAGTQTVDQDLAASDKKQWALLHGAISQCGGLTRESLPPWAEAGSWYIYPSQPATCPDVLLRENQLLCVADKLNEIDQAVSHVVWKSVPTLSGSSGTIPAGDWDIPVQGEKDRTVVREIAANVLAHIARLDAFPVMANSGDGLTYGSGTCARLQAHALRDGAWGAGTSQVFGATTGGTAAFPQHPGQVVSAATAPGFAADALALEAHTLRTAGRMMHDLIRRSFFADLAGAAQRGAQELDNLRAGQVAWGLRNAQSGTYNSLAHAARVLSGRWELGAGQPDLACGGSRELDVLPSNYGADGPQCTTAGGTTVCTPGARDTDVPALTPGRIAASRMLASVGALIPANKIDATDIRAVVRQQLKGVAAKQNEIVVSGGDYDTPLGLQAKAIDVKVDAITPEDFRFAASRNLRTYQMLANVASPASASTPGAFLASEILFRAPSMPTEGTFVAGGLERTRLVTDVMPRAGGLIDTSQCAEPQGVGGGFYADTIDTFAASVPLKDRASPIATQDSFAVGQSLMRRLTVIDAEIRGSAAGPMAVAAAASRVAEGGVGELRAWAGPGRVLTDVRFQSSTPGAAPTQLDIWLFGVKPEELNVSSTATDLSTQMLSKIALVYGPPWVAECATGKRLAADCPANFDAQYVFHPTTGNFLASWSDGERTSGFSGAAGFARFDMSARPPQFNPVATGASTPATHVYVIAKEDPKAITKGFVVGSFPIRTPVALGSTVQTSTSFAFSTMQRELFDALLGFRPGAASAPELGPATSAMSGPSSCLDGVPEDFFVPLENELTSDSDQYESSWKHYLSLARAAAERADLLGQKLIDVGLSTDLRREGAGEAIAEICGTPVELDKVKFATNGDIIPPSDDPVLSACLGEQAVDVAFLGRKPPGKTNDELLAFARAKLGCTSSPPPDHPNPLCAKTSFSFDFLGVVDDIETAAADGDCTAPLALMDSVRASSGFNYGAYDTMLKSHADEWASPDKMQSLAQTLHLEVDKDAHWQVMAGGYTVMDSAEQEALWPGCLVGKTSGSAPLCDPSKAPLASSFSRMFRECSTGETTALGACGVATTVDGELMMLRFRVESALFEMGALSGMVPSGMFTSIPIPIVDTPDNVDSLDDMMKYDDTHQLSGPDGGPYVLAASSKEGATEASAIGNIVDIDYHFKQLAPVTAYEQLPPWYATVYRDPTKKFKHVFTSNAAFTSTESISPEIGRYFSKVYGWTANDPGAVMGRMGQQVDGVSCPTLYNSTPASGPKTGPLADKGEGILKVNAALLRQLNSLVQPNRVYRRGYVYGDGVFAPGAPGSSFQYLVRGDVVQDDSGSDTLDEHVNVYAQVPPSTWHDDLFLFMNQRHRDARGFLSAVDFAPSMRTAQFVGTWVPPNVCTATTKLAQSVALSCLLAGGPKGVAITKPPKSVDEHDLPQVTVYLKSVATAVRTNFGAMYLEGVPKRAIVDILNRTTATGSKKGTQGAKLIEIENRLLDLGSSVNEVNRELDHIASAYSSALKEVEAAKLTAEVNQVKSAAAMARAVISAEFGLAKASVVVDPGTSLSGGEEFDQAVITIAETAELMKLDEKLTANGIAQIMIKLSLGLGDSMRNIERDLNSARQAANDVDKDDAQLGTIAQEARMKLAIAAGADFATVDGKVVTLPVNTVNNRLYNIAKYRYDRALKDAKYLALVARKAIEQRIGVRLDEITSPVGVLPPPHEWAADICRLQGINYEALSKADPDAGPFASKGPLDSSFVDPFVGDYVEKLANFVEYYNIAYPSHDGDDTAILSLKDDLLAPEPSCTFESHNLLYYSDRPYVTVPARSVGAPTIERRWQLSACSESDGRCLVVYPGASLESPSDPPPEALKGQTFWLRDEAPTASCSGGDAGTDACSDSGSDAAATDAGADATLGTGDAPSIPRATLTQEVQVEAGTYVLSWWDQSRTSDGKTVMAAGDGGVAPSSPDYVAAVWDAAGTAIARSSFTPVASTTAAPWSERRSLTVTIPSSGRVRVGFAASVATGIKGSVALANPQFERVLTGGATVYQATDEGRTMVGSNCPTRSSSSLRSLFERKCEGETCFYELTAPLTIDTRAVAAGSRLDGKVAKGNFNYRHISVALNLVGTGVRDCSEVATAGCYGSGFLEYTLRHDGSRTDIIDWAGDARRFDFGVGVIEHGKVLTAERYITLPIGSADQSLISQPGIQKTEYMGRPLDGSYGLRIYDSPALRWNRLDDVQLVLRYRYWSRVTKSDSKD